MFSTLHPETRFGLEILKKWEYVNH
jgi:hypothetical protein